MVKVGCKMPKHAASKKSCHKEKDKKCGMQAESTCICICVFQFTAPDPIDARIQFGTNDVEASLNIFLQQNWDDPQLALPWQPPDLTA